jgi:hypothetical protein
MAEEINDNIKNIISESSDIALDNFNKASETVSNITSQSTEVLKNTITEITTGSGALMGLFIVIIIAIICAVIIYWIVATKIFNKSSIVIERTKIPVKGFINSDIIINNMPITGNGFKKTFTFWLYLDNMNDAKGMYKHVFHIGSDTDTIVTASPFVFFDKDKNKLYVRFGKKNNDNNDYKKLSDLSTENDINKYMEQGVTLDYIPMQRWVHIGIVVNETLTNGAGGSIYTYIDSELSGNIKTNINLDNIQGNDIKDLDNLDLDKLGSLIVGGTGKIDGDYGFNGLLSKVKIFNYDLNSKDIYNDYSEGPIDGYLAALGYGLRTPVFKLSDM